MSIADYEYRRVQAREARNQANYLRDLYRIATCGLPMQYTGIHYGNRQVETHTAARVADMYLIWAAENDATAERIEAEMEAMLASSEPRAKSRMEP